MPKPHELTFDDLLRAGLQVPLHDELPAEDPPADMGKTPRRVRSARIAAEDPPADMGKTPIHPRKTDPMAEESGFDA